MPTPGLSLVGFLDEPTGVQYLQRACVFPKGTDLSSKWTEARNRLGAPVPNAGHPTVASIPARHNAYISALSALPWMAQELSRGWELKLVEIAPLLAFQLHVDTDRSSAHCSSITSASTVDDLLPVCLPQVLEAIEFEAEPKSQSVIIKSKTLNLRVMAAGRFTVPADFAGVAFGPALPCVQVVSCDGRCYLSNGYHRAHGLIAAGVTHIPCLYREVKDYHLAGIADDGSTFSYGRMCAADPPTVAHLDSARAYPVTLRGHLRIIHVSWAEYGLAE